MTTPLDRDQLQAIIRYHRDSLWSHRWQMAPAVEQLEKDTIQALEHYADLLDTIDAEPFHEPAPEQTPALPPTEDGPI